ALLKSIPVTRTEQSKLSGIDGQLALEKPCHLFIICSGDSRYGFDQTVAISKPRACEVKGYIADRVNGIKHEQWESAKIWAFGRIVTPALKDPGIGEDFNCHCRVIATTNPESIKSMYQRRLDAVRDQKRRYISRELVDYEVGDYHL